jgi:hypothetical protein
MPASSFGIEARAEPTRVGIFENIDIDYASNEKSFPRRERERGEHESVVTCRKSDVWRYSSPIYSSLAIPINWNCACRLINQKLNPNFGYYARSFPVIFHPKTALNQFRSNSREPRGAEKISALYLGDMVSGLFGSGGSNPGGLARLIVNKPRMVVKTAITTVATAETTGLFSAIDRPAQRKVIRPIPMRETTSSCA